MFLQSLHLHYYNEYLFYSYVTFYIAIDCTLSAIYIVVYILHTSLIQGSCQKLFLQSLHSHYDNEHLFYSYITFYITIDCILSAISIVVDILHTLVIQGSLRDMEDNRLFVC